jgi:hypothetical protein
VGAGRMKRTELRRYTELRSYSTLRRGAPLRPVSDKRRRDNTERRVVVTAMRVVSDGRCPRCGLYGMPLHGHERLNRSQGGDIIHPDVLICDPCNGAVADDPRVSCWNGWTISPKWPHDPSLTPSQARSLDGLIVEFEMPVSA